MELEKINFTDNELVKLSLQKSDNFSILVERYEKQFLRYIKRLGVVQEEDAKDLLQEIFIKIYLNLNDFDEKLKFSSWAYRIAHNETISLLRTKIYSQKVLLSAEDWEKIDGQSDLFEDSLEIIEKEKLIKAIEELPIAYKEVIYWRYFEQRDYEEISDILRKPQNTVAVLLNRAKKILKKKLVKFV